MELAPAPEPDDDNTPDDPYRGVDLPPQDNDAERAVLGSMLQSKDAIAEVVEIIRGSDYYRPAHEQIHDVILDMFGSGDPVDPITVVAELTERGQIGTVGGPVYVAGLMGATPSPASAAYYAEIVRAMSVRRRHTEAATRIGSWARNLEGDVDELVDRAQAELFAAAPHRASEDYLPVAEIMESVLDEIEALAGRDGSLHGVPTGFIDLDDLMGGLHPGQMVTVAGRPAMGKSTLGLDWCRAASIHHNMASVIFSLEMSKSEIVMRLLSAEAKVPLANVRTGRLGDHEWAKIAEAMGRISRAPLFIDDSANMTMTEIRAKARRLKQRHDLRLAVIDYMQLMSSGKRVESRQVEVSEFSRQIKLLAKEIDVPFVALSQLNRGPEQRSDKRPMMSDLRESGSIEQDSDVVILVHRPDAYEQESTRPGEADLIVAKHRNGPTRDVTVAFQGHYARFVDMAQAF